MRSVVLAIFIFVRLAAHCLAEQNDSTQKNMNKIKKSNHVSLVFAGQNLKSPVSSFGHTFLLFHQNHPPEPDSIILEYLGNSETPFFVARALFWNIPGAFRTTSWNEKRWENEQEDRDVWIISLKMSPKERRALDILVEKIFLEDPPYNFIFANCSWYIFKVLADSFDGFDCFTKPYVLPTDTIEALRRCNRLGKTLFHPSGATKILYAENRMSGEEKKEFKKFQKNIFYRIKDPPDNLQTTISEWINYKIPREDIREARDNLYRLKKKYNSPIEIINGQKDWNRFSKSGTLELLIQSNDEILFKIAPAQMNFLNILDKSFWADRLEILSIKLAARKNRMYVSNFDLIDLSTNQPRKVIHSPFTRDIYLGYKRYNLSETNQWSHWGIRFGQGKSYKILHQSVFSLVPIVESGVFFKQNSYHWILGAGLSVRFFVHVNNHVRLKTTWFKSIFYDNMPILEKRNAEVVFFNSKHISISAYYENLVMNVGEQDNNEFSGISLGYFF